MVQHKRKIYLAAIGAILSLAAFACTRSDDPLRIVRNYNDAVILAHRTGDISKLSDVAGEREARIVGVLVNTKRGAGLVLEATLERIEVLRSQKSGPDSMIIETSEQWRYYDRPLKPGSSPGQVIEADMKVQYECERTGKIWKVMKVKVLENKFKNQNNTDKKG